MGQTRFIVAGNFIDGSGSEARRDVFLAVQGNIITAIGSAANLPEVDGTIIDDFSHCVILPALVDCSVSLAKSPSVDPGVRSAAEEAVLFEKTAMVERHIRYCHAYGVQGVASSDDQNDLVKLARKGLPPANILEIKTSIHLDRSNHFVDGDLAGDFLKIDYSTNVDDKTDLDPGLNHADLGRILQNRAGRKAVVVANGRQRVREAIAAGCDAIEQGYAMGEENLREMTAKKVLWIPNVLRAKNALDGASSGGEVACRFSQRYVAPGKPDPGARAFWQKILAEQLAQLRLAKKLGVPTAVGTGAGSVGILHGESMVEEMKLFIKAGYSLTETIRCASENGARFFGMNKLGELKVGQTATFLITRGTVKQLPRKLAYLESIYVAGSPSNSYQKTPINAT